MLWPFFVGIAAIAETRMGRGLTEAAALLRATLKTPRKTPQKTPPNALTLPAASHRHRSDRSGNS
jgi:hypothetical protein